MPNILGTFLKETRNANQFLQKDLAECLHIDTPMYSKIERGKRKLKEEQIKSLSEFLHIKSEKLYTVWLADKISRIVDRDLYALEALELVELDIKKNNNGNKKI